MIARAMKGRPSFRRERAASGPVAYPLQRRLVDRVVLDLPMPVSVNRLFTSEHRRSPSYRAWADAAGWRLLAQRPGRIEGRYDFVMLVGQTKRDIDNLIKAASDLLVEFGVVEDDRHAADVRAARDPMVPSGAVRIVVTPAAQAVLFGEAAP